MIFGFGKSSKKDKPSDEGRELNPAIICKHVLEGMKGDQDMGLIFSRDEEGDFTVICEACQDMPFDPKNFNLVAEGQVLSYAKAHGVKL